MAVTTWTQDGLTAETMIRQGLAARQPVDVAGAVRSALALQAQDPAAPYLALWNRIDGFDPEDLDQVLIDGVVAKTSLFRFTLHLVATSDLPWARAAMRSRVRDAGYHDILDDLGLGETRVDELLGHLAALIAEPRDNATIEHELAELVPDVDDTDRLWSALRAVGAFRHAPTFEAPWSFGRRPVHLACVPAADDAVTSTAELVRRYLAAFGPATIADVSQFTILKRSSLRKVVDSMDDVVAVDSHDGAGLMDLRGRLPSSDADTTSLPPRLLGMWDSVLLAYADRSRVIPEQHRSVVIRRNGDVLPAVLIEGLVRGVWRVADDAIDIRAFEPLDDAALDRLDGEARSLCRLLADREADPTARFAGWWDRLPDGPTITIGS